MASLFRQWPLHAPRREVAKHAATKALRLRQHLNIAMNEAVCVYDVAERLGIEVRFVDVASLEGMYVKPASSHDKPIILVSAFRPPGRQASTCAHELGHHVFGHGTRIDQYVDGIDVARAQEPPLDAEEVLANAFGAFFLMPKAAVERGFRERGLVPNKATAHEVFTVAGWLGVGYSTLIHHMWLSLHLMSQKEAGALLVHQPKRLRADLLGKLAPANVVIVDLSWSGRPVDLQVGDIAVLPAMTVLETSCGERVEADSPAAVEILHIARADDAVMIKAQVPGLVRVEAGNWAAFVRVSRRAYIGRNMFRHLEPVGREDPPVAAAEDDLLD